MFRVYFVSETAQVELRRTSVSPCRRGGIRVTPCRSGGVVVRARDGQVRVLIVATRVESESIF